MRSNTPDPRLPLEPEEYPLYKPPSRIGCSALTILPLLLIAVFAFLFWRVTPQIADAIVSVPRQILNIPTSTPEIQDTPSAGGLATQTVPVPITPTLTIAPTVRPTVTPTPVAEYFKVANTGGQGVRLRAQPQQNADRVTGLAEGIVVMTIGPDEKNADGNWKHVSTTDNQYSGWINSNFLVPTTKP